MEQIKEAFYKVKQDIDSLKKEIETINKGLSETRESLVEICEVLKILSRKNEEKKKEDKDSSFPAQNEQNPASASHIPTENLLNSPYKPLKDENKDISTGNRGVPTDRQTDQQTDQHMEKGSYNPNIQLQQDSISNAAQILNSLDNLKKEIRLKFKRLTEQEFSVFSTIYQLEEEKGYTDYKNLSEKLNLTESSIRDYVGRLIKKGIPVDKVKINNKTIHLSVSQNLKKIASLPTILQLRAI